MDFISMQWNLWDSTANIDNPLKSLRPGQTWKGRQLIGLPMPIPAVKETTYTFKEYVETEKGKNAIIDCSYTMTDEHPEEWPKPYDGKFRMKGMFGFLRKYRFRSAAAG